MPDMQSCIERLSEIRERMGWLYGSEDLCVLLYSLVKRARPQRVVELGTGFGVSTAWIAAALKENETGVLHSYDNGSHYASDPARRFLAELEGPLRTLIEPGQDYPSFMRALLAWAGVADFAHRHRPGSARRHRHAVLGLQPFSRQHPGPSGTFPAPPVLHCVGVHRQRFDPAPELPDAGADRRRPELQQDSGGSGALLGAAGGKRCDRSGAALAVPPDASHRGPGTRAEQHGVVEHRTGGCRSHRRRVLPLSCRG
ncbi:MAG: class I SAM-dependent methyltransferase [Stenotrophomonas sp.]|nr:class I SAM-dependent methyltransferase [Stenotrophomonas sp.]